MRAYQLHSASWSRIIAHRVADPGAIADRLGTRRRRDQLVADDGQLVLLNCSHRIDPRTGQAVARRELLDRIVEALSVPEVDGVVASADLLEELTLLNVLEHRLAFCIASGDNSAGVRPETVAASNFDGAILAQRHGAEDPPRRTRPSRLAAKASELAVHGLPVIIDLHVGLPENRPEIDTTWGDWIEPIHSTASSLTSGAGVWITIPAVTGVVHLAESIGFPILLRDADVPIDPKSWSAFFQADLPITIRGMILGVSALFPTSGTVAEATASIARPVRNRGQHELLSE